MEPEPLISYAQNGEDIVLWRALHHVHHGTYVDVGGFDPDDDSVTRLFYERGWRGIDVEPVPEFAERFRNRRPGNEVVEAVVTDQDITETVLHRFGSTGLSTIAGDVADGHEAAGLEQVDLVVSTTRLDDVLAGSALIGEDLHFLKIDVEGAEDQVLRSIDLTRWRPWVLVVEATAPNSTTSTHEAWEPLVLQAGYEFTLFDGLSRFYVAKEHAELTAALSYPACVLDAFQTYREVSLRNQVAERSDAVERLAEAERAAVADADEWRNKAVAYWSESVALAQSVADSTSQADLLAEQLGSRLARSREKLAATRAERNKLRNEAARLRTRVQKLAERNEKLKARVARQAGRLAALEQAAPPPRRSVLRRLRHRVVPGGHE